MNWKILSGILGAVLLIVIVAFAVTSRESDDARGIDFSGSEVNVYGFNKQETFEVFLDSWHDNTPLEQAEVCRVNESDPAFIRLAALKAHEDILTADWFVEFTDYVCSSR